MASIVIPIEPCSQTRSEVFQRAQDYAYNAGESGDFAKEAESVGLEVKEAQIQEEGGVIPGLGVNEGATRWAFKSDVGDVSEPFAVTGGYAVFTVKEVRDEGVRPLAELEESVRPMAVRKKKIERSAVIANEARALLADGDSLTRLSSLRPDVRVQLTGQFTFELLHPGHRS